MLNTLSVNPTPYEFLITFFPDHELHSIIAVDPSIDNILIFWCSCNEKLGVLPERLKIYGLTKNKAIDGVLRNVPILEKE